MKHGNRLLLGAGVALALMLGSTMAPPAVAAPAAPDIAAMKQQIMAAPINMSCNVLAMDNQGTVVKVTITIPASELLKGLGPDSDLVTQIINAKFNIPYGKPAINTGGAGRTSLNRETGVLNNGLGTANLAGSLVGMTNVGGSINLAALSGLDLAKGGLGGNSLGTKPMDGDLNLARLWQVDGPNNLPSGNPSVT